MSGPTNSPLSTHGNGLAPLPLAPVHPSIQAALDTNHLYLLEIGFYISSLLTALRFVSFLFIAVFFSVVGFSASAAAQKASTHNAAPPAFVFFIFAGVFGVILILTLVFAGLEFYAGLCLKRRQHPLLIQIVAALYCLSLPWGTALGVFTFMVLNRPSVRQLFAGPRSFPEG